MKTLTPGHKYELENFEAKDKPGQIIQFIEKVPAGDGIVAAGPDAAPIGSGALLTVNDGTTNEEVMRMLIERCGSLYEKFPSEETASTIGHLKEALYAQQSRTYDRQKRGVEGKHLK